MLPFGIGFSEVVLILVVVLLVVGPAKLPDLARTLGKGLRTARRASRELKDALDVDDIRRSVYDNTVRPWQEATRIDDLYPDGRGNYGPKPTKKGAKEPLKGANPAAARATLAAMADDPADAEPGDDAIDDPLHDPDEAAPSGPVGRADSPGRPPSSPFDFGDDHAAESTAAAEPTDGHAEGEGGAEATADRAVRRGDEPAV